MDWIGLTADRDGCRRLVSAVMYLRVPWNAGNSLTSCKPVSFSRRTLHHAVSCWFTTRYFPSIRQQRLPQWRQFHIHSPRTHSLLSFIHPPDRPWQVAFKFCDIFLPLCSCSSSCYSLVSTSGNHTKLLPLQPRQTFLRTLSSHVTVVSRISAYTIYLQMSRPKSQWMQNGIWLQRCYLR